MLLPLLFVVERCYAACVWARISSNNSVSAVCWPRKLRVTVIVGVGACSMFGINRPPIWGWSIVCGEKKSYVWQSDIRAASYSSNRKTKRRAGCILHSVKIYMTDKNGCTYPLAKQGRPGYNIPIRCGVIRCVGALSPAQAVESANSLQLPLFCFLSIVYHAEYLLSIYNILKLDIFLDLRIYLN